VVVSGKKRRKKKEKKVDEGGVKKGGFFFITENLYGVTEKRGRAKISQVTWQWSLKPLVR
jgi:hypothetical protein